MPFSSALRIGLSAALLFLATTALARAQQEITIALASGSMTSSTGKVANELGLFRKYGLDPKFIVMDSGSAATAALISRSVQFAVAGPGELLAARSRGQDVVAVAKPYSGLGATLVLAKTVVARLGVSPDAPVSQRLKALDNLVIGAQGPTSISTVSPKAAAAAAGVSMRFAYMGQPAMAAALETGAVAGYTTGAPTWATPVAKGLAVVWLSGPKGDIAPEYLPATSAMVQAMRPFAEANPELVRKVAAVFVDLGTAAAERPAEVRAALAKLYPDMDAPTLELLFASETLAWRSAPLTVQDMAHEIAYMKLTGAQLPNLDSMDPAAMLLR